MCSDTTQQLNVSPAGGSLGAFVHEVDLASFVEDESKFGQLRSLAVEREVLFLPAQDVAAPVFEAFAHKFGEVLDHPAYAKVPDAPSIQVLESTPQQPTKIEMWHSDMTFSATPPSFTILHGQIIPDAGGDTLWAGATAAYEALSEPMKAFLEPLQARHDFRKGFAESLAEPGGEARLADAIAANPPADHPLIRTHPETGKKSIYVNPLFTDHIVGLSSHESEHLLTFLYQHITTAEFTIRLNWQPGMIAIWDNRSVQHKPINDYFPAHRKLHRVTIKGDRPQ